MIYDIKKCPFCGESGKLIKRSKTIMRGVERKNAYVYCSHCDVRGPRVLYYDKTISGDLVHKKAIEKWNRRCE